jgi:hypothetical protein
MANTPKILTFNSKILICKTIISNNNKINNTQTKDSNNSNNNNFKINIKIWPLLTCNINLNNNKPLIKATHLTNNYKTTHKVQISNLYYKRYRNISCKRINGNANSMPLTNWEYLISFTLMKSIIFILIIGNILSLT